MTHEIVRCSCGAMIQQCRCFHADKTIRVIENGCRQCRGRQNYRPTVLYTFCPNSGIAISK